MNKSICLILFSFFILNSYGQETELDKKFFVNAELTFSVGVGNVRINNTILDANYERTYGAKVIVGREWIPRLSAGGMAMYDYYSESGFLLLGPDVRYSLAQSGDFEVFVSAAGGYGIVLGDTKRGGGLFYYPSLAVAMSRNEAYALVLSVGYKRQYFEDTIRFETLEAGQTVYSEQENDYSLGFMAFSLGFQF
jgi:hypothetical protein